MRIYDISVPISHSLHVYKGDPAVRIERSLDLERGDVATVSRLDIGAHTGTHVDAPLHFIRGGRTVDQLDLSALIGPAQVIDVSHAERVITARDLQSAHIATSMERILCKTGNAALWSRDGFQESFAALGADAAQWLLDHGVRLVGIDYLSIEPFGSKGHPVHHMLLEAGVIIVEGLNLSAVSAGTYQLVCLPIKIAGADGAPARAVLIES